MTVRKSDKSSAESSSADQKKAAPKDAENQPAPSAVRGNARQKSERGESTGMARQALEERRVELANQLTVLEADRERHLADARTAESLIDEKHAHIADVDDALKVLQEHA